MRYRLLGRTGMRVSEICLGAMAFGGHSTMNWGSDEAESRAIFDAFAEAGGNFIDTACSYGGGESERMVGRFVGADRDKFVIASKYTNGREGLSKAGNSRKNMMRSVEESLKRLNTDYIDLFYLHIWDRMTPIDEVMRGFDDLVSSGKILYAGCSNTPAWEVSRANAVADLQGRTPFVAMQLEVSLLERSVQNDLLPMANELDIAICAYGPLAGGLLARPPEEGTRKNNKDNSEQQRVVVGLVAQIARDIGATPSQVAVAALRKLPGYQRIIPIIGASKAGQIRDSLGCLDIVLNDEQVRQLQEASAPKLTYPHAFLRASTTESLVSGGEFKKIDNHRALDV